MSNANFGLVDTRSPVDNGPGGTDSGNSGNRPDCDVDTIYGYRPKGNGDRGHDRTNGGHHVAGGDTLKQPDGFFDGTNENF